MFNGLNKNVQCAEHFVIPPQKYTFPLKLTTGWSQKLYGKVKKYLPDYYGLKKFLEGKTVGSHTFTL